MMRCAICYTRIQPEIETVECPECQQPYHRTCWDELGGCASYGCGKAVAGEKPPAPAAAHSGWGDSKVCPVCEIKIGSGFLVCSCGAEFPHPEPMTATEYTEWKNARAHISATRKTLVTMFILSLSGILAPISGLVAGVVAWRKRELLLGSDGTYLAVGYGAAILGLTYSLVLVLVILGW